MRKTLPLFMLLAAALGASAQSPITILQADYPATVGTVPRYQDATLPAPVPATPLGANQTWDYRNLVPTGAPYNTAPFQAVPANPAFAGAQWTRPSGFGLGPLAFTATSYFVLNSSGAVVLGRASARQATSLKSITGNTADSVVVNKQTTPYGPNGLVVLPLPLAVGTRAARTFRYATTGTITVTAYGLSKAPFRIVSRGLYVDSVAGWGTVRVPVSGSAGGSRPLPVLLNRFRGFGQDSAYLNGSPAPAALLSALGITQGAIIPSNYDEFRRQGSVQPVLSLYYPNRQYGTPNAATYSLENNLLTTRDALALAVGGLGAWPNPAAADAPLTLTAGDGRRQPLRLTVRDVLGRAVAAGPATTGLPTGLLRGLPAGTYLLEAEAPDGARSTLRVVRE